MCGQSIFSTVAGANLTSANLCAGDSLSSLQKAVDQKESSRQQLREQLDTVERETRAKLLEIDAFNTQLKVDTRTQLHFGWTSVRRSVRQPCLPVSLD